MRLKFFLFLFYTGASIACQASAVLSSDSLFSLSRNLAFNGQRDSALKKIDILLDQSPKYWDAWVLKGRILAWEKRHDEARIWFRKLRKQKVSRDIYNASTDVEIWSKNYRNGVVLLDEALKKYPLDSTFLFKKAKAHYSLDEKDKSLEYIDKLIDINPLNKDAADYKLKLQPQKKIKSKDEMLFEESKKAAFSGRRDLALKLCDSLIERSPNYWDAWVLKGRILTWEKRYSKGRKWFKLLRSKKANRDVYSASINLEAWSKNYLGAIKLLDEALKEYPDDPDFLFSKAKIYYSLEEYEEALVFVEKALAIDQDHEEALALKSKLKALLAKNHVGVHAHYNHFAAVYDPIARLSFDYKRATGIGSFIPRINFVNRFGRTGSQLELDYYPKLKHHWSMYLSYGYSESSLYPSHRAGFELYRGLGHGYEMSAGFRYLRFSHNVMIYTGSLSKYIGNYLFTLRPFITPKNDGVVSASLHFTTRRYLNDELDYFSVEVAAGRRPDANQLLAEEIPLDIYYYRSAQLRARYINIFKSRNEINFQIGTEYFELPFSANEFTWRFIYAIAYKYNF